MNKVEFEVLRDMLGTIKTDTDNMLSSDFQEVPPELSIKYKDMEVKVDIEYSEMNDFIQNTLTKLIELVKENYIF